MLGRLQEARIRHRHLRRDYCIGCRYCEVACPYGVPKFEWTKAAPRMVKCELCNHRIAQGQAAGVQRSLPAPGRDLRQADDLLREARRGSAEIPAATSRRSTARPTAAARSALHLARAVRQLGLPALGEESTPSLQRTIQHAVYRGFAAPVALYGLLGAVMLRNRRKGA
jgi:ferredoxin